MVRLIQCKEHQTTIKLRLVWKHGENEFDRDHEVRAIEHIRFSLELKGIFFLFCSPLSIDSILVEIKTNQIGLFSS
jgi:hypothetical protein